jgi:hypothetical protein
MDQGARVVPGIESRRQAVTEQYGAVVRCLAVGVAVAGLRGEGVQRRALMGVAEAGGRRA